MEKTDFQRGDWVGRTAKGIWKIYIWLSFAITFCAVVAGLSGGLMYLTEEFLR